MARVLCRRARLVSHLPGVLGLLSRTGWIRTFSAPGSSGSDEPYVAMTHHSSESRTVWPDETMGPFGPQDWRFQLPGNVGFDCHLESSVDLRRDPVHRVLPDVLTVPSSSERHEFILAQFVNEFQGKELSALSREVRHVEKYFENTDVEFVVQPCPELLRQDLELMFPEAPASGVTVVTVTQRTQHDMSTRCKEVNDERAMLLSKFVSGAKEMCQVLHIAGFWADFIDPSSGLAFFGSRAPLGTAEPQHALGFRIEDLGYCKLIRQDLTAKHELVGAVFTSAPPGSLVMRQLQGH